MLDVGVVGVGAMGGRIATRLRQRGHRVLVHDVRAAAMDALVQMGAEPCQSPEDVANRVETVVLSLPTPEVVHAVAVEPGGLIGGSMIRTCVDMSTTGPTIARQVAQQLSAAGIEHIDAPVSGGVRAAEAGTLTVMAACSDTALAAIRPLLDGVASKVFHVARESGMGQLVKVLNNQLSATALVATAEVVALGAKSGLDPRTLIEVFNASSGRSSATEQKFPAAVLPRTFDFGFALSLMNKDVQICIEQARNADVPMEVGEAVGRAWADAQSRMAADSDCTEIVKLIEDRAGTTLGASSGEPG